MASAPAATRTSHHFTRLGHLDLPGADPLRQQLRIRLPDGAELALEGEVPVLGGPLADVLELAGEGGRSGKVLMVTKAGVAAGV